MVCPWIIGRQNINSVPNHPTDKKLNGMKSMKYFIFISCLPMFLAGCISKPLQVVRPPIEIPPPIVKVEPLAPVDWDQVDGWLLDHPAAALEAFQKSCRAIGKREKWQVF